MIEQIYIRYFPLTDSKSHILKYLGVDIKSMI